MIKINKVNDNVFNITWNSEDIHSIKRGVEWMGNNIFSINNAHVASDVFRFMNMFLESVEVRPESLEDKQPITDWRNLPSPPADSRERVK